MVFLLSNPVKATPNEKTLLVIIFVYTKGVCSLLPGDRFILVSNVTMICFQGRFNVI